MYKKISSILKPLLFLSLSGFSISLLGMHVCILPYDASRDYEAIRKIAQKDKVGGIAPAFQCLSDNTLVARLGSQTVGFIDYMFSDSEPAQLSGYLKFMGVVEYMRGQGIGSKLLARALSEIEKRGAAETELRVFESNLSAIRLYEKTGFSYVYDCGNGLIKMVRANQKRRADSVSTCSIS